MKKQLLLGVLILSSMGTAQLSHADAAAHDQLSDQLGELKLPESASPQGVSTEKLYSVQSRANEVAHHVELDLGATKNFTGSSFLNMTEINLTSKYHISDRWNVSVSGSYGFNSFTESAKRLMQNDGILPDAAIVKWRADALLGYNLFYGKFRFDMDSVFYFDQYVSVGPGVVNTQYATSPAAVADVGFALWFGKNWTAHFGVKNDFFNEKKAASDGMAYHLLGHLDVGYLIGGETHYE